jgi:hypothetical protein
MNLYFGDLHNHTGYSDGRGRPEQALAQMRERGLDFAALTDHAESLNIPLITRRNYPNIATPFSCPPPPGLTEWEDTLRQATLATQDGFLALRGFEFSSSVQGHVNVWFSKDYVDAMTLGEEDLTPFWRWLATAEPGMAEPLAGFNHPGVQPRTFDHLAFRPEAAERLVTLEIFNRDDDYFPFYLRALDNGWRLGAIGVSDHHRWDWGSPQLAVAGVYAEALTAEGLREALVARRVYATRERGLHLALCLDGVEMGGQLRAPASAELRLEVDVEAAPRGSDLARVEVYSSGGSLVAAQPISGRRARSVFALPAPASGERWYVVKLLSSDRHIATASAIWVQAE